MTRAAKRDVFGICAALTGLLLVTGCSDTPTETAENMEFSPSAFVAATVIGTDFVEQEVDFLVPAEEHACLDEDTRVKGMERRRTQLVEGPNGKLHANILVDRNGVGITGLETGRQWVLQPDIFANTINTDPARPGSALCGGCQLFHLSHRALAIALDEGPNFHIRTVGQLLLRPDGTIANFFQRREFLECFPSPSGPSS